MYNQNNHHKRMLPKRDEQYRTEFPGNYYSSSSVYSYSPTSTTDCPEHGQSRRRTTLILVTSVVLVALLVLSIAGIAAYLGIISKNISNNASQYEESYLQSNTSKSDITSEEEELIHNQGRSRHDLTSESDDPGWIDLTNSLSDTKTGIDSKDNAEDLISPHKTNVDLSGEVEIKNMKSAEVIKGTKMNLTLNSNRVNIEIAPRPVTVVVTSTSITSTSHDKINGNNHYINPVDMIPPPTREQSNSVSYFTEESTSVKSFTKAPPRHNRNRHRYPLTNSHSLIPSTTTQSNSDKSEEQDQLASNKDENVSMSISDRDVGTKTNKNSSTTGNDNKNGNSNVRESSDSGIFHLSPSDAKNNENEEMQNDENRGSISDDLRSPFNEKSHHENNQNTFEDRLGLVDGVETLHTGNVKENEDDPQRTTHLQHQSHSIRVPISEKPYRSSTEAKKDETRPQDSTPDYYVPITPIISAEKDEGSESLLNNHKMHLTFDRISPAFYDKNPWTPLLNRPNMDKRPRVDVHNRNTNNANFEMNTTPQPIIVWNTGEEWVNTDIKTKTNPSPSPNPPLHNNYYGYGHSSDFDTDSRSDTNRNHNGKPTGHFDNRPISHGIKDTLNSSDLKRENHDHTYDSAVNLNATKVKTKLESIVEETTGGFRPVLIPSYTVIIPHIPNPRPSPQNSTSHQKESSVNQAVKLTHKHNNEKDEPKSKGNLNTSFKMDRMGELAVSQEKNDDNDEMKNVNMSNNQKNDNEQREKNDAEEIRDEDYIEVDDLITGDNPSPTKIYRLDPDTIDIVPDTLGNTNQQPIQIQDLLKPKPTATSLTDINEEPTNNPTHNKDEVDEEIIKPDELDPIIKTTTDLIMSTLGSLNLIKSPKSQSSIEPSIVDVDSSPKYSDISEEEALTETPLFPPVRSYVGVNLPLRPKPTELSETTGPMKQLRFNDENEGGVPVLKPDLTGLHKVLSMMMKFDGEEQSRDFKESNNKVPYVNISKQNVHLMLKNINGTLQLVSTDNGPLSISTTPFSGFKSTVTTTHREQKSFSDRESKIDEQFLPVESVEHVPVPLIVTESPEEGQKSTNLLTNSSKLTSVQVNDKNSPVYKFVLKKGQAVEDLLKEIFQNYTDVLEEEEVYEDVVDDDIPSPQISEVIKNHNKSHPYPYAHPSSSSSMGIPAMKSLDESSEDMTTVDISSTTVRINPYSQNMPLREPLPIRIPLHQLHPSTSDPPLLQTVTSIVINEEQQIIDECPANITFRCVSTGKCIPSYLRCNFIKECPDNSDEDNCSCADFLKANGNARKLCDGVVDCGDATDEYEYCDYCQPGQYICAGSRTCINRTQICDSKRDCQNGDDENECVKIGRGNEINGTELEELSSTYHKTGQLMVRKKGIWGKLCVETFSSVVSHWEVKDLARAVCKALTFSDFESVERVRDKAVATTEPYYELFYGLPNNGTEESSESETSSSESTPRSGLGFRKTECKSKLVVNVTCQDLQCGTAPRSFTQTARIVGGANSMPGKWPWQAALYKNGEYQCGATLISSRWLLSAGHCFYHAQDDHWVARLGTLRRGATVLSPYEQVVRITNIFLHPQYKDVGFVNDISLLRLEKEVNFTDYVRPVCLPSRENKIRDGRMCTVVGWGQLFEVGRVFPDTLQEVQLPLISTAECRKRTLFLPLYKLSEQMFCAGFDRGGRDACLGDSGGPLMCLENDGRWSLYGVTSNGYGCARANRPGVYTKVASYLDWIYEKMSQEGSFVYRDKSKPCPGHRCLLGECLDKRQVCNGIRDCIEDNGSDERGPNCTFTGRTTNG